jgi:perosamine synthetase
MVDPVPVNEPLLDGNEGRYLQQCLDSAWISSEGPFVKRFEHAFAKYVGRKHGVAVCNGTAALEAAMAALDIGPGDEIILSSFSIISCAASIVRRGAKPVLVDSDARTWNMDVTQVENKITPQTKAILVVHTYGLPTDMDPLVEIAHRYRINLVEDAAEAIGQTYKGRPCGSFGDISTLSFYANKHVTTGEGGMILTDDDDLAERCRLLRNLCFLPEKRFFHEELGWNFRMTNLQAAVGLAQLENLDAHVERKRRMGGRYTAFLRDLPELQLPLVRTDYADNIYWIYGVVLEDTVPFDAEIAMSALGSENIGTRPFFWPTHEQPVFRSMDLFGNESYPVAERLARRGFYLPSGLALADAQIERVAQVVRGLVQ